MTQSVVPERDRPVVLLDLLMRIEERTAAGASECELDWLRDEYCRLREEL